MKMTELFLSALNREVERSRRALQQVPEGRRDWKPHDRSMAFGSLCDMVATMPSWMAMMVNMDELDIAPKGGQEFRPPQSKTSAEFIKALDKAAEEARAAPRVHSGHHGALGTSSRTDDGVPPADGPQGAGALRAVGRRPAVRVAEQTFLPSAPTR